MNRFSVVLFPVLIALAIGAMACVSRDSRSAQGELEVIANELKEEYDANAVAASLKYRGKEIIIGGSAIHFYPRYDGVGPAVTIGDPLTYDQYVTCEFSPHFTEVVAGLKRGTWLKLTGLVDPSGWGRPHLQNCRLLEQGTALEALAWLPEATFTAATVRDTVYTYGDLVERLLLLRATGADLDLLPSMASAGRSDDRWSDYAQELVELLGNDDVELHLLNMVEAEIVRQGTSSYGTVVNDEDVDAILRSRFNAPTLPSPRADERQLAAEYQQRYRSFLADAHITDEEYRALVSEDAHRMAMRDVLGESLPKRLEHVNVSWIRIPNAPPPTGNPPPTPSEIYERLRTEDFNAVAYDVGGGSAQPGWVPRGAYPELDSTLFGPEGLSPGYFSGPVIGEDFTYILTITGNPEVRQLDEVWVDSLKEHALEDWISDQWEMGQNDGWLSVHSGSHLYDWVAQFYRHIAEEELNGD